MSAQNTWQNYEERRVLITGRKNSMSQQKETERVREIFDASAAHYDRGIAFSEKLFFGDGRA